METVTVKSRFLRRIALATCVSLAYSSVAFPVLAATIPAGTPVTVRVTEMVSPDIKSSGDIVRAVVADDVKVGGRVLIAAGAPVRAEVIQAKKSGILGQAAKVIITVHSVNAVDGTQVSISGAKTVEGDDKVALAVIGGFLCLFPFLIKGGGARIPSGAVLETTTTSPVDVTADAATSPAQADLNVEGASQVEPIG